MPTPEILHDPEENIPENTARRIQDDIIDIAAAGPEQKLCHLDTIRKKI